MTQSKFLHSGEFHYFRVRQSLWYDRLAQMRDIGLNAVSIYVPWNWHEPRPGKLDFTGEITAERNLIGVLEMIDKCDLKCIFRPGPYITAEWRDGGIPSWLWEQDPQILSLDARGNPSAIDTPYPAICYDHAVFRSASEHWLDSLFGPVQSFLAEQGGPIINIQLEDEPSYWHLLENPLLADYNPVLVSSHQGPSQYARWLLSRYGSIDRLNQQHHSHFKNPNEIQPPREEMIDPVEFVRYQDWLYFKLERIDDYVAFLFNVIRSRGVETTLSVLYPYLRSVLASKFTDYVREHHLALELTNECYNALFVTNEFAEHKVGHIITTHETYHMWRGEDLGPPVCLELQSSNASFVTPTSLEILYDVTIARGIKGINYYMMVGGENPAGYENITGREYDIWAAVSPDGEERPHARVIRKLARILNACEQEIMPAQPMRDIWLGYYGPYEAASLSAGGGALSSAGVVMNHFFSTGDNGLSDAISLQSLLALSSISYGCVDLERISLNTLRGIRQLWLYSLDFMSREVQEKLLDYVQQGGQLVIMPCLPRLDEHMQPCTVLQDAVFKENCPDSYWKTFSFMRTYTPIEGSNGESLISMGSATAFKPPKGADILACRQRDGQPCAFELKVGHGKITVIGFGLQYVPAASMDQRDFVIRIVENTTARRFASTSNKHAIAMELASESSALLCVINPVNHSISTSVSFTLPATNESARLPQVLSSLELPQQGALLLPVEIQLGNDLCLNYASCELIGREINAKNVKLVFATRLGGQAEIAIRGVINDVSVTGGKVESLNRNDQSTIFVIRANSEEIQITIS